MENIPSVSLCSMFAGQEVPTIPEGVTLTKNGEV